MNPGAAPALGTWMIAAGGLFLLFLGPTVRGTLLRSLGLALATGGVSIALLGSAGPWAKATATILAGVALPFAVAFPLRALGARGGAHVAGLGLFALLLALPVMVGRRGLLPGGFLDRGAIPDWVMVGSPLARLHGSVLGSDWFHAPGLYPRVGEAFYTYPAWDSHLVIAAGLALAGLLFGAAGARQRRRLAG